MPKYTRICVKTHTEFITHYDKNKNLCYYHRNSHGLGVFTLESILDEDLVCKGSIQHIRNTIRRLKENA